jgi:hypothetical protein
MENPAALQTGSLRPLVGRRLQAQIPKPELSIDLPQQQYQTCTAVLAPFDATTSHGGKFETLIEALVYVTKHCEYHHRMCTRALVRLYLPFCRIIDFTKGCYAPPLQLSKREFDAAFNLAQTLSHANLFASL